MNESFFQKLKQVRFRELLHFLLFAAAVIPALFLKRRRPHLWLICESRKEARDNGYWFFRYLRREQPQVDAVYAIDPDCAEYRKVSSLGETVKYGSLRHWICYLACEVNASSIKGGKPNAAVGYFLEVVLKLYRKRFVFLQHGITQSDVPSLHADKCAFSMFCCGADPEYRFVRDTFGYPEEQVRLVGFSRFDGLYGAETDRSLVVIIPTWRMYLERNSAAMTQSEFASGKYFKAWNSLLNDGKLDALLASRGKHAVFCLHRNMGEFERYFSSSSDRIRVLPWENADIGSLLREAGTLITDYSSVFLDFSYMYKPVLLYQFDREEFRSGHLPEGYFDYDRDAFGPVCEDEGKLLEALEKVFSEDCELGQEYREKIDRFFTVHDSANSERIYQAILEMLQAEA